ncbi:unnamed protein product [Closterium sp. Naga37s-1]|nr:unnamed protein product [Closterium sp. Naga37s-1]
MTAVLDLTSLPSPRTSFLWSAAPSLPAHNRLRGRAADGDYEGEQQMEVEALEAILMDEFESESLCFAECHDPSLFSISSSLLLPSPFPTAPFPVPAAPFPPPCCSLPPSLLLRSLPLHAAPFPPPYCYLPPPCSLPPSLLLPQTGCKVALPVF